ncbi:hypothetical protein Dsin_001236 [Dipteronia sinensis]|uniref:Pentatricopeptide repeat-containing protein n=1 Tax=Dipteronia sinensis TaxID=43782 RepID=A0AAE0B4X0_9ROSI|nr:hypothetical protein Dsin_001236 [Dipteronia sinensis]
MERAKDLMEEMVTKGIDPDVVTYNTLINGYCNNGIVDEALKVKTIMEWKDFEPNVVTYNTISSCLCKLKLYEEVKTWLFAMIKRGFTPNVAMKNTNTVNLPSANLEGGE